jgi:hypothetical protein
MLSGVRPNRPSCSLFYSRDYFFAGRHQGTAKRIFLRDIDAEFHSWRFKKEDPWAHKCAPRPPFQFPEEAPGRAADAVGDQKRDRIRPSGLRTISKVGLMPLRSTSPVGGEGMEAPFRRHSGLEELLRRERTLEHGTQTLPRSVWDPLVPNGNSSRKRRNVCGSANRHDSTQRIFIPEKLFRSRPADIERHDKCAKRRTSKAVCKGLQILQPYGNSENAVGAP